MANYVNGECRSFPPRTGKFWKKLYRQTLIYFDKYLTELESFGPIAGEVFSVSEN